MTARHPDCPYPPEQCRVSMSRHVVTQLAWTPVHDGNGMLTNADPNTFTIEFSCTRCGGSWQELRTGDQITTNILTAASRPS